MGVEFACDWIRLCHAQEPVESVTNGSGSWRVSALRCLAPGCCRGAWDLIQVDMVCERPPRSLRSRLPLTRGRIKSNLPLREGESRRRRQGVAHTSSRLGISAAEKQPGLLQVQSVIVEFFIQTLSGNSQHLSGEALVTFALGERVDDELSFGFFERQDIGVRESSRLSLVGVLDKPFREIRQTHNWRLSVREQHLHKIFQFPNVAGPRVLDQSVHSGRLENGDRFAVILFMLLQEMIYQQRDIFTTFAKRGNVERDYTKAIVKIFPDGAGIERFEDGPVGGCDHANVD